MQVSRSEVAGQISGISLSSPSSMCSMSPYSIKLQSKFLHTANITHQKLHTFWNYGKALIKTIADCHTSKKLRKIFSVYDKQEEKTEKRWRWTQVRCQSRLPLLVTDLYI